MSKISVLARGVLTCGVLLATLAIAARVGADGTIFDDDWTPPKRDQRPSTNPTPPPAPAPAPVSVPPGTPNPPAPPTPPTPTRPPAPDPVDIAPSAVAAGRRAVPAKAELTHSRTLLQETFAHQLADHTLPGRARLAQTLLDEAAKCLDNPADQYALFGGAFNAAKEAANLRLAFRVADQMAKTFDVDAAAMKASAALTMPLKADSPARTAENALAGLELLDAMVAADDFVAAAKLCSQLRQPAASDPGLTSVVQKRSAEVDALRAAHDRAAPQFERLEAAPNDPAANLAVGSYECFVKGDWNSGLARLAVGSDAALAKLAADELAHPADPDQVVRLADGWWNVAAKQPAAFQPKIRHHAAMLYSSALGSASSLQRLKIEKRIAEAGEPRPWTAALHEAIFRQSLARFKDLRDRLEARPSGAARSVMPPAAAPYEGDVTLEARDGGFSLAGGERQVGHKDASAHVRVPAGFCLEGGKLVVAKGTLELLGEPSRPILLKNVTLDCELGGAVNATCVVFDNCSFAKTGGWFSSFSSKWIFNDCLLCQSNFKGLSKTDYGVKLTDCTFVDCKLPGRNNKPGDDDSGKLARHEWSHVQACDFYGCELSVPVFWMTQHCNFYACKAIDTAVFSSTEDLTVELGLSPEERDRLLADLRGRTTINGSGKLTLTAAAETFSNQAFPAP